MKILIVNSVCGSGSTGRLCAALARRLTAEGHEVRVAYGRASTVPDELKACAMRIGTPGDVLLHGLRARLFDGQGFGSRRATRAFLREAERFDPELLWLHNLHGYYIDIEQLFAWIKARPQMVVRWTLHDCWAFTGRCSHFNKCGCTRWKTGCGSCPQKAKYPAVWGLDRSAANWRRKREAFSGVRHMTLLCPSEWLAGLAKQSFLGQYPVQVVPNTVDRAVFHPREGDFRRRYGLENEKLLLGAAAHWYDGKGLEDFVRMAALLPEGWRIVLLGLTRRQRRRMPGRVLALGPVSDPRELAAIYSCADVFVNPSYEDTYPSVNLEALACETPVVCYDSGGGAETVPPENRAPTGDAAALLRLAIAAAERGRRP